MNEKELKRLMELKSGSIRAFALENEIPYTTIRSILERGILNAKAETVFKICSILNIRPEIFEQSKPSSPILQSITETSSKLEENRQIIVLNTAKNQLDEQNSSVSNQEELFEYDYYDQPASAGTGQYLNDVNKETVELPLNMDADFVIPIYGDSMEPEYHSGDYAFIKSTVNLNDGQVGVFELNGDAYIKQLIIDGNKACLHSFNAKYEDIYIDEFSDFRIIGKVVGSYSGK